MLETTGLYLYAYLVGAVPTAYLIGRWTKGIDIRQYGSGNVGATNLAQHVGRTWVAPLLLFEILAKGASPILVGQYLLGLEQTSVFLVLAPLAAVAGHNWSAFLHFQGGRGIIVIGGALLALSPLLLSLAIAVFLVGWALTRSSGVWVLLSLFSLPLWALALDKWVLAINNQSALIWFYAGSVTLMVLKRLLSNWQPLPLDLPKGQVLLNRLLLDRDVARRADWVGRIPG